MSFQQNPLQEVIGARFLSSPGYFRSFAIAKTLLSISRMSFESTKLLQFENRVLPISTLLEMYIGRFIKKEKRKKDAGTFNYYT